MEPQFIFYGRKGTTYALTRGEQTKRSWLSLLKKWCGKKPLNSSTLIGQWKTWSLWAIRVCLVVYARSLPNWSPFFIVFRFFVINRSCWFLCCFSLLVFYLFRWSRLDDKTLLCFYGFWLFRLLVLYISFFFNTEFSCPMIRLFLVIKIIF